MCTYVYAVGSFLWLTCGLQPRGWGNSVFYMYYCWLAGIESCIWHTMMITVALFISFDPLKPIPSGLCVSAYVWYIHTYIYKDILLTSHAVLKLRIACHWVEKVSLMDKVLVSLHDALPTYTYIMPAIIFVTVASTPLLPSQLSVTPCTPTTGPVAFSLELLFALLEVVSCPTIQHWLCPVPPVPLKWGRLCMWTARM